MRDRFTPTDCRSHGGKVMIENPFATPKRGGEVMLIENPFIAPIKRDGKLTPERWYALHLLIGRINALEHDAIITAFCEVYGLSRRHLKAQIKAFRLASPPMLQ